ncbi:hypothetical protein B0T25DRAFT_500244 [Lasiosphaeria hispida]|uniref:EKC/KEOPS complex subunit BUD32 n=1 Tax=Lasiosphaeria hispida TaxID=260671 RepID=A0AAJ0HGL7_9PEZI|nr:hypothetical protein B0T25DRAFT_500244 [Lasiosphaeria hispida]
MDDTTARLFEWDGCPTAWASLFRALAARIDSGLAPDVTVVSMAADGTILSTSVDPLRDATPGTQYAMLEDYQLPGSSCVETISRDELVEVARLAPFVDVVTPVSSPSRRLVFKHYEDGDAMPRIWHDIQIPAMLSAHPNIVSVQHLVVHEKRGAVVGFTVPFIPGGSLLATRTSRTFKLKWAKQLFHAIDDLNLKYGVVHHDVRLRNLMVDPATDDLVLIDFDRAAKPGGHGKMPDCYLPPAVESQLPQLHLPSLSLPTTPPEQARFMGLEDPDVYAAIIEVYSLVTQSPTGDTWIKGDGAYWGQGAIDDAIEGPWVAHPDARLDHPALDYHAALVDWLSHRRQGGNTRNGPPPFDFADHMPVPAADVVKVPNYQDPLDPYPSRQPPSARTIPVSGYKYFRRDAVQHGRAVVEWARPASAALDRTRTLLATGKYAGGLSLPQGGKEAGSAAISVTRRSKRLAARPRRGGCRGG